jgi:regulator of replication initiation timing
MKALIGGLEHRPVQVLAELTALRSRVAELRQQLASSEAEKAALRAEIEQLRAALDREVVLTR